jgi:hypothetical protein
MKKRHKVERHQFRGETCPAAEGQPANMPEAIDRATASWPLFSMFDASFRLQRLREDTNAEFVSPAQLPAPTAQEPGAPSVVVTLVIRHDAELHHTKKAKEQ